MRPFLARFSEPVWSGHLASWADFITTFSVHTVDFLRPWTVDTVHRNMNFKALSQAESSITARIPSNNSNNWPSSVASFGCFGYCFNWRYHDDDPRRLKRDCDADL